MSTYRERREARVERLRGWADGRREKSDKDHAAVQAIADQIPLGQPILVGHHSERHARRDQDRIQSGMRRAVESSDKAKAHDEKADNIERQLDHAIYDDDPDARERLTERIAAMEAKRARCKAINAAIRRQKYDGEGYCRALAAGRFGSLPISAEEVHDLAHILRAWGRVYCFGFPPYVLTNLGGNIARYKQRLAALDRPRGPRPLVLRYGGKCDTCGVVLDKGEVACWIQRGVVRCVACAKKGGES